jgi:hypothetical protein
MKMRVLKWMEYKYVYPSTDKYRMNERRKIYRKRRWDGERKGEEIRKVRR